MCEANKGCNMSYKIAIDGPSAAGKSTVSKLLSKELGYVYIDTGALYRAVALYLIRHNINPEDEQSIKLVINDIDVNLKYENDEQVVLLNGENVNRYLRTNEISQAASKSSVFKSVRDRLLSLQRKIANENSCVMDGRDIASKVLPDANLKIFLTASVDSRAKRRYDENISKGIICDLAEMKKEIEERDYRDTHRENDPLMQVKDAKYIDSTDMTIEEVLDKILSFT